MKTCARCHEEKPFAEFNRWSKGDGYQPYCRVCTAAYYQANATKHKAAVAVRNKRIIGANQERVIRYLARHPCVDCGESDPVVLDFDHVRGVKVADVSLMIRWGSSWGRIGAEIEKCDVRCANCHRRKTARERGYYRHGALVKLGIDTAVRYDTDSQRTGEEPDMREHRKPESERTLDSASVAQW